MKWEPMRIPGAWVFTPTIHEDDRGLFLESYTARSLREATGFQLELAQINISVSRKGVVRGLHACKVPPGQAKYVQCVAGEVLDVVVDIDPRSASFGQHDRVILNDTDRRAVFISDGLAHGFCAWSDSATVVYATSSPYSPEEEFAINPFDSTLGISWGLEQQIALSEKDRTAPTLGEALSSGLIGG